MNNTKWREVWTLLADMRLRIHFAFANGDKWNHDNSHRLLGPFPVSYVLKDGIRDPGIGGPFSYKQILWIRVPAIAGNDIVRLRERLLPLGQLPIRIGADYIEIRGYDEGAHPSAS